MNEFRDLDHIEYPLVIREMRCSPLILVKKSGEISWASGRIDKDAVIQQFTDGDTLLFAWSGKWSTDVFKLTKEDIKKHYGK